MLDNRTGKNLLDGNRGFRFLSLQLPAIGYPGHVQGDEGMGEARERQAT